MNKGVIRISSQFYEESYDIVSMIFKDFKPLKIDYEYWRNNDYVIYGLSNSFDIVEEACVIPEYAVEIMQEENETYTYKFIKQ